MRRWPLLCLACALMLSPTASFAADADEDSDSGVDDGGTVVATRAPKEKSPQKVRRKFFSKAKRLEIAPFFGFISNNPFNQDMVGGLALAYHFSERIAVEVQGQYGFLSGTANEKGLAGAVLQLLQSQSEFYLEATDPGIYANVDLIWSPMYGKINPMGLAVINLDFYFALGVGYFGETIEMLRLENDGVLNIYSEQTNSLFAANLGLGMKIFLSRSAALRIDARFYLTLDQTLDFSNTDNASANHRLPGLEANRLSCGAAGSAARCTTSLANSFVVTVGGSFFVPGAKKEPTVASRDN
ncbi:outer membrane beta-barrel domain-containing protein [Myxococcota bacterium]|nr:outer membrane beta-barrel domain-containing protein [Myxococcota bacterium]